MATVKTLADINLTIKVRMGQNADGSAKYKNYTYAPIALNASADNILLAGKAIADLMVGNDKKIIQVDQSELLASV